MDVSAVGLGRSGSPRAAPASRRRLRGADLSPNVVDKLNRGEAPVVEPGLQALTGRHTLIKARPV